MNKDKTPLIEMLAFFCRYSRVTVPTWRKEYVFNLKRVRSCHSKQEGGIKKCFYSIETKEGEIFDLEFNQEELLWTLDTSGRHKGNVVDRILVYFKRHKHLPSEAHRVIPYRFEIYPASEIDRKTPIELAPIERMQPYRFVKGRAGSIQVKKVETRHLENKMIQKDLHYVIEDTEEMFYHLVYILDLMDWRFLKQVDEQFFFVR